MHALMCTGATPSKTTIGAPELRQCIRLQLIASLLGHFLQPSRGTVQVYAGTEIDDLIEVMRLLIIASHFERLAGV